MENKQLTVADLRVAIKDLPDDTLIHVTDLNDGGFYTVMSIMSSTAPTLLNLYIEDLVPIE
jgi:hypothetical protein